MIPEVSIVMPIKNQEPFLEECLNSIRKQTKQDWELIVVDDHSDDQSSSILSIWAKKEPRIQTFENPGSGIVDALNFGISKSNSDLIARMDGDDLMHPLRLEEQSKFLQHNQALGVVSCEVIQFTHSKENKGEGYAHHVEWTNQIHSSDEHKAYRFVDCLFAHPSVLFRKKLVTKYGGYRKGDHPEDFELWLRWLSNEVRMGKIPQKLLWWRDHPDRTSRISKRYDRAAFHRIKAQYLKVWLKKENPLGDRKLFAWGAGRVARKLISEITGIGVSIDALIDLDPKKIGKDFQGIPILSHLSITSPKNCFLLVLVGSRGAREEIIKFLEARDFVIGKDFFPLE